MEFTIGKKLGRYEVVRPLGSGGMGHVYLARDTQLERNVAIKILPEHMAMEPKHRARFKKEARAVAVLSHPNILSIHDIGMESGVPYAVMEFLEGRTLREYPSEPMPWQEIASIGIEIAKGLAAAHEKGVIHRDLKPDNIFVTSEGTVKILDFGLAQISEPPPLLSEKTESLGFCKTMPGEVMGTAGYISPEQAQSMPIDARTDLFPLGCVLYELATGKKAFYGETLIQTMLAIISHTPDDPRTIVKEVPDVLAELIVACLEKDPNDRVQSAREVVNRLRAMLSRSNSTAITAVVPLLHSVKTNRLFNWALLIPVFLLLAIGLVWLADKHRRETRPAAEVPEAAVASPSTPQNAVKTLAVAFFENRTGEAGLDWLSKGVPDMLISYLSYSEYLQVVGIEKLQDVMRSLEDQDPAVERNPAFEVARLTQAEILVMGSVVKSGGSIRIIASIYETNQARLIKTEYVEGRGDDQLFSLIDELSGKIKLALEIEASGEKPSEDLSRIKTNSLSAYKAYMEGLDRLYEYNDQEAISSFQKAIQIDPAFGHAYLSLARTYDVLGENSLAREAMERAMTHSGNLPKVEKAIFKLAQDELNGDWEAALESLKALSVIQPNNIRWRFRLAFHYETHHFDLKRGISEYEKAIEIDPKGLPLVYHYLGLVQLKAGHYDQALQAFRDYAQLMPDLPLAHDSLGLYYLRTGQLDEAKREFEAALALQDDYVLTLGHLGEASMARGQYNQARQYFERFLSEGMGKRAEIDGLILLGRLAHEQGDFEASLHHCYKALALDRKELVVQWLTGLNELGQDRLEAAEKRLSRMEEFLKESKSRFQEDYFLHLEGRFMMVQDRNREAGVKFQELLALGASERQLVRRDAARAARRDGRLEDAVKQCEALLVENPSDARAHVLLGEIYMELSQPRQALAHFTRFLELWANADPDIPLISQVRQRVASLN